MKGCLPSVIGVVYLVIRIRSVERYIRVVCQQMSVNFNLVYGCMQLLQKPNSEKKAPAGPDSMMMMKRKFELPMGMRMELYNPVSTTSHQLFR